MNKDGQTVEKLGRKRYEKELSIVFEGRDTAGKGGVIKRITERVSPACSGSSRFRARPSGKEPDVRAAPRGAHDRKRARLNIISHILEQIPYEFASS